MFARFMKVPDSQSFFLFGPRGTGKSTWVRSEFPDALYLDLLDAATYSDLVAHPEHVGTLAAARGADTVVIDEVQKAPALLDEVHRLIENAGLRFVLTGSSARKLRRSGTNLLAGRARTHTMHPLTAVELGERFDLSHSLRYGQLPGAYVEPDPGEYLRSYVGTYLREEVLQESLVRNMGSFARFVEAASFSQASVLSISAVAADCGVPRKTVATHFELLEDLLLGIRLQPFHRRARRNLTAHPKFYYFDAGVYRALRPRGPLDSMEEIDGAAVETLVLQELRAHDAIAGLGYQLSYWRTSSGDEVDFVLYGERGFHAIEVKRSTRFRQSDLKSLRLFAEDYPEARCCLLYGGSERHRVGGIDVLPLRDAFHELPARLAG